MNHRILATGHQLVTIVVFDVDIVYSLFLLPVIVGLLVSETSFTHSKGHLTLDPSKYLSAQHHGKDNMPSETAKF